MSENAWAWTQRHCLHSVGQMIYCSFLRCLYSYVDSSRPESSSCGWSGHIRMEEARTVWHQQESHYWQLYDSSLCFYCLLNSVETFTSWLTHPWRFVTHIFLRWWNILKISHKGDSKQKIHNVFYWSTSVLRKQLYFRKPLNIPPTFLY